MAFYIQGVYACDLVNGYILSTLWPRVVERYDEDVLFFFLYLFSHKGRGHDCICNDQHIWERCFGESEGQIELVGQLLKGVM